MSREPSRICFADTPASPVAAVAAGRSSQEPQALSLDAFPSSETPSKASPTKEPGPLTFKSAPSSQEKPATSSQPKASPAAPKAVSFSEDATIRAGASAPSRAPGAALFEAKAHPAQAHAEGEARLLEATLFDRNQELVVRLLRQLLPFKKETVESWGASSLEACKDLAIGTARATQEFAALRSTELIEGTVAAITPRAGLLSRFKEKLGPSREQREASLRHIRGELERLLKQLRGYQPEADKQAQRLACHLLALRAVVSTVGMPTEATFEMILDQRLATLQAALTQALLVPAHLKATEDTIVLQVAQCDRLLAVTLSAVALSHTR